MNIIARTAVLAAAAVAGLAPAASATAGRAPVTAAPSVAGCPGAGWRTAATIAVGQFPFGVAVDTRTDMIYAASWGTGTGAGSVSVINGQTRTVAATVAVGQQPYGVAVNPQTDTVYVTNGADGTVSVINGQTNTVTATIGVGGRPYGIWADRLTNQVFVAGDGGVTVIDGQTNTVVDRIATGADPFWLALDPATGILYVTDGARLSVTAINVTTDQIVATIFLRFAPYGIAMDPKTDTAYVVVAANHLLTIDGRTNADNRQEDRGPRRFRRGGRRSHQPGVRDQPQREHRDCRQRPERPRGGQRAGGQGALHRSRGRSGPWHRLRDERVRRLGIGPGPLPAVRRLNQRPRPALGAAAQSRGAAFRAAAIAVPSALATGGGNALPTCR